MLWEAVVFFMTAFCQYISIMEVHAGAFFLFWRVFSHPTPFMLKISSFYNGCWGTEYWPNYIGVFVSNFEFPIRTSISVANIIIIFWFASIAKIKYFLYTRSWLYDVLHFNYFLYSNTFFLNIIFFWSF